MDHDADPPFPMSSWWLDETGSTGAEHLDPAYVSGYETKAAYDPSDDLEALALLGLGPDSTVVDLGAGPGGFATAAATRCRSVVAVDVSPAMTAVLRAKRESLGLENLTVVEAGFLSYVHEREPVDFVFSRNALHQVPDFWKGIALRRIHDLLCPGGVLLVHDLIYDFEPWEAEQRITEWFDGAVTDPRRGFTTVELATHVRTEHSTYCWLFEVLLEHAGFEIFEPRTRRGAYATYTCRRID